MQKQQCAAWRCAAHHHMTTGQYGVWLTFRVLAGNGACSTDNVANHFAETTEADVQLIAKQLERKGWLIRVESYLPETLYRVVSHTRWAKLHHSTKRRIAKPI